MPREATPEELALLEAEDAPKSRTREATPEELALLEEQKPARAVGPNEPQFTAPTPGPKRPVNVDLEPMSTTEANLRVARKGMSLGLADEAKGLEQGFLAFLASRDPEQAKQVYRAFQKQEERKDQEAEDRNPLLKSLTSMVPYMALGGGTGGVLKEAARGALQTGGMAAAQAFGESKKQGLQAAEDAIIPGAIGGVLGAVGGAGRGLSNRGAGLAEKARQQAAQEAQARVSSGLAEQAGKMGSAKADINRAYEVLLERGRDPLLSSEAKIASAKALRENPQVLSELVASKAEGLPGQISRYDSLARALKDLEAAAPEEQARITEELLKTPGAKDYLASTKLGRLVQESPIIKILREPTSPAHKMANSKLLGLSGGAAQLAKPGPVKLSFAEWLKNKDGRNGR